VVNKATDAQALERRNQVLDMMLDGASRYAIVRYGTENWGITEHGVEKYIKKANAIISKQAERDVGKLIDKTQRRLERLLAKANNKNDLHTVRLVIKDIRDLYGLDRPAKIEQIVPEDIIVELIPREENDKTLESIKGPANQSG